MAVREMPKTKKELTEWFEQMRRKNGFGIISKQDKFIIESLVKLQLDSMED